MQQLNDDMDELFREAANQYPLSTEGENWDAVMNRLQPKANPATILQPKRPSRWLWSLLLLPLLFIAYLLVNNNDSKSNSNAGPDTLTYPPAVADESQKAAALPADSANAAAATPDKANPQAGKSDPYVEAQQSTAAVLQPLKQNAVDLPEASQSNTAASRGETQRKATGTYTKTLKKVRSSNYTDKGSSLVNAIPGSDRNVQHAPVRSDTTMLPFNEIKTYDKSQVQQAANASSSDSLKIAEAALKDSLAVTTQGSSVIQEKKTNDSKWYIGFVASPDMSTVKWQKAGKTGYGLGVLVGYSLSKRFSLETGLLWDRKYYYSKGEYADPKKIPANWNVQDIDGWCQMFEIPLQVRYNFSMRSGHSWYVNAGLSSYIMNRENYDYNYENYGTIVKGNSVYDNETRNWFSIIHMGVGYEKQLGIGKIRIEPYAKIPAGGLGWAGLPITSFGLNLGITKALNL